MSKFCAKCGANLAANAGFCPLCGFAANAKLPVAAPEKKPVQQKAAETAPQSKNSKKSPLGIIPIIIAAVTTVVAIILLVLLLLPDNKCDICGEKSATEYSLSEIASDKTVFLCDDCIDYINPDTVVDTAESHSTEPDVESGINADTTKKQLETQKHPQIKDETTTKQNNISGGDHNISESSTATLKASESISQNNSGTNDIPAKVDEPDIIKTPINIDGCKLTPVELFEDGKDTYKVNFKVAETSSNFKKQSITLKFRALDKDNKELKIEKNYTTIAIDFNGQPKKGDEYTSTGFKIPDRTAVIEFYVDTANKSE